MTQPVYLTLLLAITAAIAPAAKIWTVSVPEPAHHPILDKGLATLPIWGISDLHRDLGKAGICDKVGGASSAIPHLFMADSSRKAGEIVWSQVSAGTYTLTVEVWLSRDWASSKRVKSLAVS